jgi:hypothetical protein
MLLTNLHIPASRIQYKILYHTKGYIRLEIPSLRKLALPFLFTTSRKKLPFPVHPGIRDFHINPLKSSLVIVYEPDTVNILDYINSMASDPAVKKIIEG